MRGGIGYIYKKAMNEKKRNLVGNERGNSIMYTVALLICIVITFLTNLYRTELFSAFAWTIPCMLIVYSVAVSDADNGGINQIFTSKILQFLGDISFELFLWHQLVMRYVLKLASNFTNDDTWYLYLIAFAISVLLSYITHKGIGKIGVRNRGWP